MLTHRNFYVNAYDLIAHLRLSHHDVELWTLPMFHCNGWGAVYALTGLGGTHVVLRTIDARQIFTLMADEGVTFACMAPTVLRAILDYPDKTAHTLRTRPRFTVAGAPPPAAFIERLEKDLGFEFLEIYGLTETAPLLTSSQPDFATRGGRLRAPRPRGGARDRRRHRRARPARPTGAAGRQVDRRGLRAIERRVQGLLEAAGGDPQGHAARLLSHRRPRGMGRGLEHPHRRPQEGRHHLGRRERVLAGGRGRALQAQGGARVRGDRRAAREVGRDPDGHRGRAPGRLR